MPDSHLTVALVQMTCGETRDDNQRHIAAQLHTAASMGAQLVLLQELHYSRYFCQREDPLNFDLAEPIPGPGTEVLCALARELELVIVGSLFERRTAGLYHNTAVVIERDGSLAGRYRKMHIPDDPGYHEKFYFTPGDLGFCAVDTSLGKLGVLVCWDQWYPEAARLMALSGAQLLLYPTAIGWDPSDPDDERQRQRDAWQTMQRAHAIANGIPVLCCNRTGFETVDDAGDEGIQFWGGSFVAGPQGELVGEAGPDQAELLIATLDMRRTEQVRRIWPYLRDRRIDAYQDLLLRFRD
jgi:N-carbamoylputrescine amidase